MNNQERFRMASKQFDDMIKKHGWASHYVPFDEKHINYHTHGVMENYNHYDLQITLPIDPKIAHTIVANMVNDIKDGKMFEEGMQYFDYLKAGYPVGIRIFTECERNVMRVLICDENKLMPYDVNCNKMYKYQLDVLEK